MSEIGDRLKKYRESIPKTLDELADETGIPKSNLGYYETKGQGIPVDARDKLKVYGAPIAWILTGEGVDPTLPIKMVKPGDKGTYEPQVYQAGAAPQPEPYAGPGYIRPVGSSWEQPPAPTGGPYVTETALAREAGRLEGKIEEQGKMIGKLRRRLNEALILIQDLGRRAGIEVPPQEPVE